MPGDYIVVYRSAGTLITQLIYNNDHQNHIDARNAEKMGAYGISAAQFQLTEDPYPDLPPETESLPPSLAGEITRLRFVLAQIISELSGNAPVNWYDPVNAPGFAFIGARVVRSANFSIPDNLATIISFSGGTVNFNSTTPAMIYDDAAQPTRFTAPVAGKYYAFAACNWAISTALTRRTLSMALSSGAMPGAATSNLAADGSLQPQAVAGLFDMAANDYIQFSAYQNSGGPLNLVEASRSDISGSIPAAVGGLVFLGST